MDYEFELCDLSWGQFEEIALEFSGEPPRDCRPPCRYFAMSPSRHSRKTCVFSFVEGIGGNLSSKIAVNISHDAIGDKLQRELQLFEGEGEGGRGAAMEDFCSSWLIRDAFAEANRSVYGYASKMATGAKISATGFLSFFGSHELRLGQVGAYEGYLWRDSSLSALDEHYTVSRTASSCVGPESRFLERLMGAAPELSIDLASTVLEEGDVVVLSSLPPDDAFQGVVEGVLHRGYPLKRTARILAREAVKLRFASMASPPYRLETNVVFCLFRVGRFAIRLEQIVS